MTPPLAREQLAQLFDASPEPFSAFSAVRDEAGIRDLRFVYANPAAARFFQKTAAELEGKLLLDVAPSHKPIGLFGRLVRVLESGVPDRHSFFYVAQGISGWFRSLVCRWGDGVTVQLQDETERVGGGALSAPGEQQRALRAGFQVFVAKPVEPAELIGAVAELVASRTTPDAWVVG